MQDFDEEAMEFELSEDADDWSHAMVIRAYDIGEAVDAYLEKRGTTPAHVYARIRGEEQFYDFSL